MTTAGSVWLVRHAPTDWTGIRWCGRADPSLQREGLLVAVELAARLAGDVPAGTPIWTSPLRRARQTAAAIGVALGSEPLVVDDLVEVDVGRVEGLTWGELSTRDAATADAIAAGGPIDWPGGETAADVAVRAGRLAADVRAWAGEGRALVVVSHGAFLHSLARALTGPGSPATATRPLEAGGVLRLGIAVAAS